MGARRKAREYALMILYQIDVSDLDTEIALERFFGSFAVGEELDPPPPFVRAALSTPRPKGETDVQEAEAREYAQVLVRGVSRNLEAIDTCIQGVSAHWRLERMARVDRNILRMGTFELLHLSEKVPRKVVINEAVEIAKTFSTAESSAFINGILDRVEAQE